MNSWEIQYTRSAAKELEKLSTKTIERIRSSVNQLTDQPRPMNSKKLKGDDDLFRIRVGDYRVIYEIDKDDQSILIIRIRHRKEAY